MRLAEQAKMFWLEPVSFALGWLMLALLMLALLMPALLTQGVAEGFAQGHLQNELHRSLSPWPSQPKRRSLSLLLQNARREWRF